MKALVIGYGSIGERHDRILSELGHETMVVSAREIAHANVQRDLPTALSTFKPDYVVVANATAKHFESVGELADCGFEGIVLVEKPLFDRRVRMRELPFRHLAVAYNLRFHVLIQKLRALLQDETILSITCYVGQYLPNWRPSADYRLSYSSHADQGGGVLRDLSHELDYLIHLVGPWRRVCALGGHLSSLEGDSDDSFGLMLEFEHCPIGLVQMNYTDRAGRRQLIINTDTKTIEIDMVKGLLVVDNSTKDFQVSRDDSYRAMHEAVMAGRADVACTLPQALETLALIDAAEQSQKQSKWICSQ